ncbi:MAG: MBL fold metallo-hydrolase [Thermodesulfobacteriota bacterium]
MKPLLHAEMINPPFGDPALFVEIFWEHRALLFDLGELGKFRPAKLLKISHVFVSHTHIDHFIGFDTLVRLMLNRENVLKIFGPPGFLSNVRGKLSGYTWNLTSGYPFSVLAAEVHPDRIHFQYFLCQERFAPGEEREESFDGILDEDSHIQTSAVHLDHSIPCLAFALQERFHINVHKERLAQMGLSIGPWLKELKEAIWRGEGRDFRVKVPQMNQGSVQEKEISLAALKESVTISPGQKIAYVADCRFSQENNRKIIRLVRGADLFFCEAAFLERDRDRAEERSHLTARQAGELAREAQAKKLHIFHFSPKYEKEADLLYREAEEAFQG